MARPYSKLRGLMQEHGDTQEDVARFLKLGVPTVSLRMCGKLDWRSSEMYALMDRYHAPYSSLHEVFPPGGRNETNGLERKNGGRSA